MAQGRDQQGTGRHPHKSAEEPYPHTKEEGTTHGRSQGSGGSQVTYNGWPLYTYTGDSKPGDANGNNLDQFGAEWYVLNAAGAKIDED